MCLESNQIIRILAIFLMLSGCASTPQHLTEESKNEIKSVAIVSLVPESVNFDKIGIISFSSKYTEFDMGSKVTNSILTVSQERIAKSYPGWSVKSIEYDRTATLAKVNSVNGFRAERVRETFADLARKNNLDAIFVVRASADREDNVQQEFKVKDNYLREGLNVLLKNNNFSGDSMLVIRANLNVVIIGKNGEVMAVGAVPAKLDNVETLKPDDYDVSDDMKHNHRPEVLDKLGRGVIVDLTRRLNLCFDSLGFVDKSDPGMQSIYVAPQPNVVIEPTEKSPVQAAPTTNSFDQCFSRCKQYTDRTKEQCFDACNK
jgi:hypothetical protein